MGWCSGKDAAPSVTASPELFGSDEKDCACTVGRSTHRCVFTVGLPVDFIRVDDEQRRKHVRSAIILTNVVDGTPLSRDGRTYRVQHGSAKHRVTIDRCLTTIMHLVN